MDLGQEDCPPSSSVSKKYVKFYLIPHEAPYYPHDSPPPTSFRLLTDIQFSIVLCFILCWREWSQPPPFSSPLKTMWFSKRVQSTPKSESPMRSFNYHYWEKQRTEPPMMIQSLGSSNALPTELQRIMERISLWSLFSNVTFHFLCRQCYPLQA